MGKGLLSLNILFSIPSHLLLDSGRRSASAERYSGRDLRSRLQKQALFVCFATTKKWPLPLWRAVISTPGGVCWALNEINLSVLSHKKSLQPSLLTQVHTPFPQCHPFFFTSLLPLPSSSNKPKKDKDMKTSRSQIHTHTHKAPHSDTRIFRDSHFSLQMDCSK